MASADEAVAWTNLVGVSASGNSLTKTGTTGWNAGAASVNVIRDGYGYVEFTVPNTTYHRFCGLSNGDSNASYTDVDFGLHPQGGGALIVYEAGTYKGTFGTYAGGDKLRVEARYGVVRYLRNGAVIYTSATPPIYPLRVDTSLYDPGDSLNDVRVGNTVWGSSVGVSVSGSNLTKTGTAGWNAGALSANSIDSGDGYVEFSAGENSTSRVVGLGTGDSGQGYEDVDFGVHLRSDGAVSVLENGISRGDFGLYLAGDRFRVEAQAGAVRYLKNGALFYTSAVAPTYPLRVDSAFESPGATVTDVVLEPVVWSSAIGVSTSGNTLTKTGSAGWSAGAATTATIASGDGFAEFIALETNTRRVAGLKSGAPSVTYSDIDFGIELTDSGVVQVVELGVVRGQFGSYVHGDRLRVEIQEGVVRYRRNGAVIYSSGVAPSYPLHADTALYTAGATIAHVTVGDLVWMNQVNVQMAGSGLRKTVLDWNWTTGAVSTRAIESGYVEVTASETTTHRMFGLSHGDRTQSHTDIDFAFYLVQGGAAQVYEQGVYRGQFGTYTAGDRLRVELQAGVVRYLKNGTAFYTSTLAPVLPLRVDTSFYDYGATLLGVSLVGAAVLDQVEPPSFSPTPGTYTAVQSVTITAISGATIRYTLDGTDPTEASTLYSGPVTIDQSRTVKAKAWRGNWTPSAVTTGTYTLKVPTPGISPGWGIYYAPLNVTGSSALSGVTLRYTTNGLEPAETDPPMPVGGVYVDRTMTVRFRGFRTGWTASDATVYWALYDLRVAPLTLSPGTGVHSGIQQVQVTTSSPGVTIHYTTDGREPATTDPSIASGGTVTIDRSTVLRVLAIRDGWTSATAFATYMINLGTVATPAMNPPGGTYTAAQLVSISSATAGADIRFTTDGTEPSFLSSLYGAPLLLDAGTTLKAKAFKGDWTPSATAVGEYLFDFGAVATPRMSVAGGTYTTYRTVVLTSDTAGATIRYTTDGLDPTLSSPLAPTAGVVVDRPLVLKAKAWKDGVPESGVRRADYVITGAVSAGDAYSLVLKADGTAWAWGLNTDGALGNGTASGWAANPVPVRVGAAIDFRDVVAIAAGWRHALAVKRDGTVWSWGMNSQGQLGRGGSAVTPAQVPGLVDIVAVMASSPKSLALRRDGRVFVWGNGSSTPQQITSLSGVSALATGLEHDFVSVLKTDGAAQGRVWGWGANFWGMLGDGSTIDRSAPVPARDITDATSVAAGAGFGLAVKANGTAIGWGMNNHGALGIGNYDWPKTTAVPVLDLNKAKGLAGARESSAAVRTDGTIWTWGMNQFGQLGDGTTTARSVPEPSLVRDAMALDAGQYHLQAIAADGSVWGWGDNAYGGLGDHTTTARVSPVKAREPAGQTLIVFDGSWLTSDADADGLATWKEHSLGSDPLDVDTNDDGLSDGAAVQSGRSPTDLDPDGDGLSNRDELARGTDPFVGDTDGDLVLDGADCYPTDATRWQCPAPTPGDTTPPVITLQEPTNATLVSSSPPQ